MFPVERFESLMCLALAALALNCNNNQNAAKEASDLAARQAAWDKATASPPDEVPASPPAEAASADAKGWRRFPLPSADLSSKARYSSAVLTSQPGEPPMNKKGAAPWLQLARSNLATGTAKIPITQIKATLADGVGTLTVASGVETKIANPRGRPIRAGICSEVYFATALVELAEGNAAASGLRAIKCESDGCSAVFDLRPTRPDGGGVYTGEACASMADMFSALGLQ